MRVSPTLARRLPTRPVPSLAAAAAATAAAGCAGKAATIRRLTLADFRNYVRLRLEFEGGSEPVVLVGPNGAGKTNLLEAISFLSPGRGLRSARLAEATRQELGETAAAAGWAVAARVQTPAGTAEVGTGLEAASEAGRERRAVHIGGAPARGQAALAEIFSVQWLTPQMDRLFAESGSGRRRFLDRVVFAFDAEHAARVSAYERAMAERARLLADLGARADADWLTALEDRMASLGVAVAWARIEAAGRLDAACRAGRGPFPGARVAAAGELEDWLAAGPALAAEENLKTALREARVRDAQHGGAASGPHRSDLAVHHAPKGRPAAECSTGEQKALLLALVLGAARLLAAERGSAPVLLLDEVAAHLDADRRAALFDALLDLGAQAWLTGTDAGTFAPLSGRARFFAVRDGALEPFS